MMLSHSEVPPPDSPAHQPLSFSVSRKRRRQATTETSLPALPMTLIATLTMTAVFRSSVVLGLSIPQPQPRTAAVMVPPKTMEPKFVNLLSMQSKSQSPSMFLTQPLPRSIRITASESGRAPWNSETNENQNGILGFDMSLFSSPTKRSNVDLQQWNLPDSWDAGSLEREMLAANSIHNQRLRLRNRYLTEGDNMASGVNSWLPWIPTMEQIDTLKRTELQEACRQRNLKVSGLKGQLRERLASWAQEEEQRQVELQSSCKDLLEGITTVDPRISDEEGAAKQSSVPDSANSLAEWARNVDLEPLLQRREKIHREKHMGKPRTKRSKAHVPRDEYLDELTRTFETPSTNYSNKQVKSMYTAAKKADQAGNRPLCKRLLEELLVATPHDTRLYRRLARMHSEEGRKSDARAILEQGLRNYPLNAHLWHGLGQLSDSPETAMKYYAKAIEVDQSFPNAYHALGTLQHECGHIAKAMKTIKAGLIQCPTNHRLYHALGDLYRDAKVLDMAIKSYKNSIFHGPKVSHGFSYAGLAYCAYEQEDVDECRRWLRQAVTLNPRQANAWLALAQMEEATGNVNVAMNVCTIGLNQYERDLLERSRHRAHQSKDDVESAQRQGVSSQELKNEFSQQVPVYRSGDRFFHVYRNWARVEAKYGTPETVEAVYLRATKAFPNKAELYLDWAEYSCKQNYSAERVQSLLQQAADAAQDGHAHYKLASFVMEQGDYRTARKLLYRGAMEVGRETDRGLPELYLTWAVCEWRMGQLSRTEHLLDHAMRLTTSSNMRSFLLYSLARLEYTQGEYSLAQHCIGLSLKESFPRQVDRRAVWKLWVLVAKAMKNESLAEQCEEQVEQLTYGTDTESVSSVNMEELTRREPWYFDIFGAGGGTKKWNSGINLPDI